MPAKKKFVVRTPLAVARYPHVTKPDTDGKFADDKFKITLVFDGDADLSEIERVAKEMMEHERPNVKRFNLLIKDGDTITNKDGDPVPELAGKHLLTAKTLFAPPLYDAQRRPLFKTNGDGFPIKVDAEGKPDDEGRFLDYSGRVFGGDLVKAVLQLIPSDQPTKNSIAFRLNAVQLVKKSSIGGGAWADAFDVEGEAGFGSATADAEGGEDDDDLPF